MEVGRPWIYGLMLGGQEGVEQVIKQILADLDLTLGLSGYKSLGEIQGKRWDVISKVDL
jgi:lactate 2-monooxygenase